MQSRLKREKLRHQEELDQLELKQDQEMRDARLQFFTMIAHEIRTPVTLIIGPLESLKEHWKQVSGNFPMVRLSRRRFLLSTVMPSGCSC